MAPAISVKFPIRGHSVTDGIDPPVAVAKPQLGGFVVRVERPGCVVLEDLSSVRWINHESELEGTLDDLVRAGVLRRTGNILRITDDPALLAEAELDKAMLKKIAEGEW